MIKPIKLDHLSYAVQTYMKLPQDFYTDLFVKCRWMCKSSICFNNSKLLLISYLYFISISITLDLIEHKLTSYMRCDVFRQFIYINLWIFEIYEKRVNLNWIFEVEEDVISWPISVNNFLSHYWVLIRFSLTD